jgi:maleate isomerase
MAAGGLANPLTTSGALLDALAALGVRTVGVGTPYDRAVSARLGRFLQEAGYDTVSCAFLGLRGDIPRVSAASVHELAVAADAPSARAVFLSCTNLRTFEVLEDLEERLGKPVLSANQVTMWGLLRAGNAMAAPVRQRLFTEA